MKNVTNKLIAILHEMCTALFPSVPTKSTSDIIDMIPSFAEKKAYLVDVRDDDQMNKCKYPCFLMPSPSKHLKPV